MKIVYFVHCYPPALGGLEYLSGEVVKILRNADHHVDVITGQGSTLDSYKTFSNGVETNADPAYIHRLLLNTNLQRWANRLLNKLIFLTGTFSPWYFGPILSYDKQTLDLIKDADLIIGAGMPTKMFTDAYYFAKKFHKRLILLPAFHNVSYYKRSITFSQALRYSSTIICSTPKEKSDLLSAYGLDSNKIKVITYCPYTIQDWRDAEKRTIFRRRRLQHKLSERQPITLGFVGQITLRKNLKFFIDFLDSKNIILDQHDVTFQLLFAGAKTNSSSQVECLFKPFKNRVKFIYNFSNTQINKIYDQIDIFINPSKEESLGFVNFEALIQGLPVFVGATSAFASLQMFNHFHKSIKSRFLQTNLILSYIQKRNLRLITHDHSDHNDQHYAIENFRTELTKVVEKR